MRPVKRLALARAAARQLPLTRRRSCASRSRAASAADVNSTSPPPAKAFSAGFDLKDGDGRARDGLPIGERIHRQRLGPRMCKAWQDMDQITIAAIDIRFAFQAAGCGEQRDASEQQGEKGTHGFRLSQ